MINRKILSLPNIEQALPGRTEVLEIEPLHWLNQHTLKAPYPEGLHEVVLAMGCFWGAEKKFWPLEGVWVTAVGYAGGYTPNPTYEEVCSGMTGHAEVVKVVYDPTVITLADILRCFWESHDPTQGMRQGNDQGTQYRSAVYVNNDEDLQTVQRSLNDYQLKLNVAGFTDITTEIKQGVSFYYAESYHQQYLAKNPNGYCGLKGSGVPC